MYIVIVGNGFTNPLSTQVSAACPSWIHGGVILEQLSVRLSWLSHYTFKRKIFQPSSPSLIRFAKDWKKVTKNPSTCSSGEYLPCPLSPVLRLPSPVSSPIRSAGNAKKVTLIRDLLPPYSVHQKNNSIGSALYSLFSSLFSSHSFLSFPGNECSLLQSSINNQQSTIPFPSSNIILVSICYDMDNN